MKHIFLGVLTFVMLLSVQSCNIDACINKSYFVATYNNFMKDLEKNHENYTEADWKSKDSKIEQFVNDCYPELKMSLTGEEKTNFWTKYVKYIIIRHGSGALTEIERADQASTIDIYDEIIESVDEVDLQNMLKEMYGEDIEEAVDEVLNQINNWGEKLKNWLKTKEN